MFRNNRKASLPKVQELQYEKDSEMYNNCLQNFRERIGQIEGLNAPTDEEFLVRFIRARKFNVDRAVEMFKNYYEWRSYVDETREVVSQMYPCALREILKAKMGCILKERDRNGRRIFYLQAKNVDPTDVSYIEFLRVSMLILEELLSYEDAKRNGFVVIVDLQDVGFMKTQRILSEFSVPRLRRVVGFTQGAFPARFKGLHMVNCPYPLEVLLNFAKKLLSKKLRKRVHSHGSSYQSLNEFFNLDNLPVSLHGKLSNEEAEDWEFFEVLNTRDEYYKGMLQYGFKEKESA